MSRLTCFLLSSLSFGVLACGAGAPPAAVPARPEAAPSPPAPGPEWGPLRPLLGAWSGTSGDAAHPSHGGFTMALELSGKVLMRRGTNDTTTAHHEDLTIIYRALDGGFQASYFDNEGHAIHYAVAPSADGRSIVFLSDEPAGVPRFRLTYAVVAEDTLSVMFDIAVPGSTQFQTYTRGEVHRTHR